MMNPDTGEMQRIRNQLEMDEAKESENDLMQDFVSLVTNFCVRLYGIRRSKRKTEQFIENLKND